MKICSGEPGGNHFLKPDLVKPLVDAVEGTLVESAAAYRGRRHRTEDRWKAFEQHGFTEIAPCDIWDANGELDLPVPNGKQSTVNYVGANLKKYESALVLSHFKGHMTGGFGGALENITIGIASSHGKAVVHGAGDASKMRSRPSPLFQESTADASLSIMNFFKNKIAFVKAMKDLSVACDCNARPAFARLSNKVFCNLFKDRGCILNVVILTSCSTRSIPVHSDSFLLIPAGSATFLATASSR